MQTIEYRKWHDVFVLYRGGMRYHKDIKDGEEKGYDPYDRYRVMDREELWHHDTPKDKTSFGFAMSKGVLLFPWFNISRHDEGKSRIAKFIGMPENYNEDKDFKANLKLGACFTMDGRLVLFKDGCKPIRREKTYKTFTKIVEEWRGGHKQYGVRNPKYDVKYWEFKNETDYIIVSADDKLIWCVLPLMYEQKLRKMISNIRSASYTMDNEAALAVQKLYYDTLWNIEPFSLDEPWDYTDEQKQYIKEIEEEARRRRIQEMYDLEQRKALPGYCDDCGCEGATYRLDPYAEEMWDREEYCWLCDDCYHERCMDI